MLNNSKIVIPDTSLKKYLEAGWKIFSLQHVLLRGLNKEYNEYTMIWDKDEEPIFPEATNAQE